MPAKLRTRLRQKRALLRRSREGLAPYLEISQIRERLDTIENRLELLEDDLELIEDNLDINSSMADNKIVTAEGTVGVGSTAPVGVGSSNDADAGRERWVKDVTDYEHKQFVEIHEKYQKLRDELEKKFKEEIEKAKAVAAAELAPAPDGELGYHVGVGSTAPVGVGSSAPAGTTHTDPDTSADGGQAAPAGTTHTDPDTSADGGQAAPDPDFS